MFVGSDDNWRDMETYDVTNFLRSGENIVAIYAIDTGSYEGVSLKFDIEYEPGPLPLPDPEITSIKLNGASVDDVAIALGQSVDIEITAKNNGGASPEGAIQASFPAFTGSGDHAYVEKVSQWSSDLQYNEYYHNGSQIYSQCNTSWVNPDYVLVGGIDENWTNGKTNTATFRVTPQSTGTFVVYIKVAMGNSDYSQYAMDPTSSSYDDQQCEKVYRRTINVQPTDPCHTCPTYDYGTYTPGTSYSTHSASFDAEGCRWYRFNLTTGNTYYFTTCEGGGSYSDDTVFTLYNSSCNDVYDNNDYCGSGSHIEYTPTLSGYHYLKIENYYDRAESYTLAYKININNPPTISIISGPSGTINYDDVTFQWEGSDSDGTVNGFEYEIDDQGYSTGYSSVTFNNLSEDSHTFRVRCFDDDVAYSSWATRDFAYDPSVPVATITERFVVPAQVNINEPFTITITVKNEGELAHWGGISISFPEITGNGEEADIIDDGSDITPLFYGPNEPAPRNKVHTETEEVDAQYMLAEMGKEDWGPNESHTMNLRVTPKVSGPFHVNVRFALVADETYTDVNRDPMSGSTDAQQGFCVYQYTVATSPSLNDQIWQTISTDNESYDFHIVTQTGIPNLNRALDEITDEAHLKFIYVTDKQGEVISQPSIAKQFLAYAQGAKKYAELDLEFYDFKDRIYRWHVERVDRDPWFSEPYTVYVPKATCGWWRELFLFRNFYVDGMDNPVSRRERYKEIILDLVLQSDFYDDVIY